MTAEEQRLKLKKTKYETLKAVIDDFIQNMDEINFKRSETISKETEYVMEEMKIFNLLQNNVHLLEEENGIPQN